MNRTEVDGSVSRVSTALRRVANAEDSVGMARYMRNQFPFLGVKTPARREATKAIVAELAKNYGPLPSWEFVERLWGFDEREFQYVVCDYLLSLPPFPESHIGELQQFITWKSWWDTVDPLSSAVGKALRKGGVGNRFVEEWSRDDNFWVRRASLICQRGFKDATDVGLLESVILRNLGSGEFIIDKAIGWALRDYSKTNPAWVKQFLHSYGNRMATLSVREASKYLTSSVD